MSRRPRISYRDLGRPTPGGSQSVPAPDDPLREPAAAEPAASVGAPAQRYDAPPAPPEQHPITAAATVTSPATIVPPSFESPFATPAFLGAQAATPRPVRGVQPAMRFRDRVRARESVEELLVFRVAGELFAVELSAVEEAMDCPPAHALPEMPASMRGVFMLRNAPVALYAPNALLGLEPHESRTVLVFRPTVGSRRTALAIDDVDDVLVLDLATLRDAPGTDTADGILAGVARRGRDLIGVLDAEALLAACRSDTVLETV